MSFSDAECKAKHKQKRSEIFPQKVDQVVRGQVLLSLIDSHSSEVSLGWHPYPLSMLLLKIGSMVNATVTAAKACIRACVELDEQLRCKLSGDPARPAFCGSLRPGVEMCGHQAGDAMQYLQGLERQTAPEA